MNINVQICLGALIGIVAVTYGLGLSFGWNRNVMHGIVIGCVAAFINVFVEHGNVGPADEALAWAIGFVFGYFGIIRRVIRLVWRIWRWIWRRANNVVRTILIIAVLVIIIILLVRIF